MNTPPWPVAFASQRLQMRELGPADLEFVARLHGDAQVMRHVGAPLPPLAARQAARRILDAARATPARMHGWMVECGDGRGRVGLMTVAPTGPDGGELGLLFCAAMSGQGHATEAVAALLAQWPPGTMRLQARHRPQNLAVRRLLARLGFVTVAGDAGYDWWRSGPATGPVAAHGVRVQTVI